MSKIKKIVILQRCFIRLVLLRLGQHKKTITIFVVSFFTLLTFFLFFGEKKVVYSYNGNNCVGAITVLPGIISPTKNNNFELVYKKDIRLLGKRILSTESCLIMKQLIGENSTESLKPSVFKMALGRKYSITVPEYPKAYKNFTTDKVIVNEPLIFGLTKPDKTFQYKLIVNQREADCVSRAYELQCNLEKLKLSQNTEYEYFLKRYFKDKNFYKLIDNRTIKTITPIAVTSSSIKNNSVIYDKRKSIVIYFDKKLKSLPIYKLYRFENNQNVVTANTSEYDKSKFTITLSNDLVRASKYKLQILDARATDGGILNKTIDIDFFASDGPIATRSNLRDRSMSISKNLEIYFDQDLKPGQTLSNHIQIDINNSKTIYNLSSSGRVVTIDPALNLPKCTQFKIKVLPGLVNNYDVESSQGATFVGQTGCFDSFIVGYSVEKRPIIGYSYGSGSIVMFLGGIHGDEANASRLLNKWLSEVDRYPWKVSKNKKIVIIPSINPDGMSKSSRLNNHSVDLNRNFGSNDWKSTVKMPWGEVLEKGGGEYAFSEPESKAVADFINLHKPYLVLSYHSWAAIAESNNYGDSVYWAKKYASKSGYMFTTISTNVIFRYDTTGSLEAWLADKAYVANVLIELASRSYDEFDRNKDAMWSVLE